MNELGFRAGARPYNTVRAELARSFSDAAHIKAPWLTFDVTPRSSNPASLRDDVVYRWNQSKAHRKFRFGRGGKATFMTGKSWVKPIYDPSRCAILNVHAARCLAGAPTYDGAAAAPFVPKDVEPRFAKRTDVGRPRRNKPLAEDFLRFVRFKEDAVDSAALVIHHYRYAGEDDVRRKCGRTGGGRRAGYKQSAFGKTRAEAFAECLKQVDIDYFPEVFDDALRRKRTRADQDTLRGSR